MTLCTTHRLCASSHLQLKPSQVQPETDEAQQQPRQHTDPQLKRKRGADQGALADPEVTAALVQQIEQQQVAESFSAEWAPVILALHPQFNPLMTDDEVSAAQAYLHVTLRQYTPEQLVGARIVEDPNADPKDRSTAVGSGIAHWAAVPWLDCVGSLYGTNNELRTYKEGNLQLVVSEEWQVGVAVWP